jgi:hypothetical protein
MTLFVARIQGKLAETRQIRVLACATPIRAARLAFIPGGVKPC